MRDLHRIAEKMEAAILEPSLDKVVESPLLTKLEAEKLSKDYLFKYHPLSGPVNSSCPEVSSYVVFAGGMKNA
jgi:hypothetical protein